MDFILLFLLLYASCIVLSLYYLVVMIIAIMKQSQLFLILSFWWALNVLVPFTIETNKTIFAEADSTNDEAVANEVRYKPNVRYPPCYDLDLHCGEWARAGECRLNAAYHYMRDNCKLSCNLCNHHLEKWSPKGGEIMSLEYNGIFIFTGTVQQLDFHDSPLSKDSEERPQRLYNRMQQVIDAQELYMQQIYADRTYTHKPEEEYSALNLDDAESGEALPIVETCLNRHAYCTFWAVDGLCDLKPLIMSQLCPLVCHVCERNVKLDRNIIIEPRAKSGSWIKNLYQRMDLHGVIEAIQENRMVLKQEKKVFPNDIPYFIRRYEGEKDVHILDNEAIGITTNSEEDAPEDRKIVVFEKFLTVDACDSILKNAINFDKDFDLDSFSGNGGVADRFPPPVTENEIDDEGNEFVLRKSSRSFLWPVLIDELSSRKFHPAIERMLQKVEFVLGLPSEKHIESPIQVDKFGVGDFQLGVNHFEEAMLTEEGNSLIKHLLENKKESQAIDKDQITQVIKENFPAPVSKDTAPKPRAMENSRIFGFTIFLNTVEDGGEIVFPNLNNYTVNPRQGSAVLFPVATSLVGKIDDENIPLDKDFPHNGKDHSYLEEDLSTLANHNPVTKGVKYSATLYIRRYERSLDLSSETRSEF